MKKLTLLMALLLSSFGVNASMEQAKEGDTTPIEASTEKALTAEEEKGLYKDFIKWRNNTYGDFIQWRNAEYEGFVKWKNGDESSMDISVVGEPVEKLPELDDFIAEEEVSQEVVSTGETSPQ